MITYKEYLDGGGEVVLKSKACGRLDGRHKHQCPCGSYYHAFMIVDVSHLPDMLTGGEKFICGGCLTTWQREKRKFTDTDDFIIEQEWEMELERRNGGDVEKMKPVVKQFLERYQRRNVEKMRQYKGFDKGTKRRDVYDVAEKKHKSVVKRLAVVS